MIGTGFEVGTRDGAVVLIVTVGDEDTGGVTATAVPLEPDDAKALVNSLGSAIKDVDVSRMARVI